ncbi:hypothetical protein L3N51_01427 [Metallosphaera sp. J1]|uniref:SDR family oxidoreductase n=1 Tax=Metallosphaera TaxID=41980 RepID=UPI001EDF155D|nr:SDR family oxidoreductase [Metallosphaera javensis (ex Hofmann et al. 2022)]MCG3109137.1 hypothetical protein [Metallosphaera javensis (ex Hofmann et al. 2022)]BCS93693.1 MAG: NAD(P)-dependent oxidoreductase [Metallosphaera javensis (ex Sakai et al. 2022)]
MRVVVTGAGGLLGKRIVQAFKNEEVIGVYNRSEPETSRHLIMDLSALNMKPIEDLSPDVIIHAAALTDVDRCEREPQLARLMNVEVTREIAKVAGKSNALLVYISTDYVFDGNRGNYSEEDEPNPVNVYGLTKLEGEKVAREVDSLVVRTSTPYGSNPASGKDNFALWLLKKLRAGEPVNVLVDQITSPTLNTNFALMLKESVEKGVRGVLHLAGKSQISRYNFSLSLARTFGLDERLVRPAYSRDMKWLARRPLNSSLNVDRAMLLGHKPMTAEEGLMELRRELEGEAR